MTKIQPITSEEVLARQVKENEQKALEQHDAMTPAETITDDGSEFGQITPLPTVATTQFVKQSPDTLKNKKTDEVAEKSRYTYRLPLGAYLLSFIYFQIFIAVLCLIVLTFISYAQYSQYVPESRDEWWLLVGRETWAAMFIAGAISLFILSGNNILRWLSIGSASAIAVLFGYQIYANYSATTSVYFPNIADSVFLLSLGIILCITTVIYLLRTKVSEAYE